jgi:hypothetical protein
MSHSPLYHQGHITSQDVDNNKWLESLARYALFDQQFMSDTEGTVLDSVTMMASAEGKRTERFSEKSLNLENSLKSEVRFPSSKETLKLRR